MCIYNLLSVCCCILADFSSITPKTSYSICGRYTHTRLDNAPKRAKRSMQIAKYEVQNRRRKLIFFCKKNVSYGDNYKMLL